MMRNKLWDYKYLLLELILYVMKILILPVTLQSHYNTVNFSNMLTIHNHILPVKAKYAVNANLNCAVCSIDIQLKHPRS